MMIDATNYEKKEMEKAMTSPSSDGEKLNSLMTALAESIAEASDKEVMDAVHATSEERSAAASRVREALNVALLRAKVDAYCR